MGRMKVTELVYWYKGSLKGKAKATHTTKAEQVIHSPFSMGRQVVSHPKKSRVPTHVTLI